MGDFGATTHPQEPIASWNVHGRLDALSVRALERPGQFSARAQLGIGAVLGQPGLIEQPRPAAVARADGAIDTQRNAVLDVGPRSPQCQLHSNCQGSGDAHRIAGDVHAHRARAHAAAICLGEAVSRLRQHRSRVACLPAEACGGWLVPTNTRRSTLALETMRA